MDILIKNARIITGGIDEMDLGLGCIGVDGEKISYIGTAEKPADRIIDANGMIAMPGLCNAHTHTPMVLMRNLVTDKPLEDWLSEAIFPIEAKMTREHIKAGSMLAIAEMVKSGTTSFLDMYYEVDATAEAVLETGMRANISLGLLTAHADNTDIGPAIEKWRDFYKSYHGAGNGRLRTSLEVHSVYLYDEIGLRKSAEFAADTGTMIHAHLCETKAEVENSIATYGMSPIKVFHKTGLMDTGLTAAHTVWADREDIELLLGNGSKPVHCPSSNMFLASGFAPVSRMLELGIPVALGTDGAASNNDLDMFREMHLAGLIHKGSSLDATSLNAPQVISMATANGARAIGFPNTGILKEGYAADIILVDMDKPHNTPMLNPVNALVYSTKGSDVDTVIVNGQVLMEGRELKTIDEEKVKHDARIAAESLLT